MTSPNSAKLSRVSGRATIRLTARGEGSHTFVLRADNLLAEQKDSPPLAAGEIISTGTLTDAHPVQAGETWSTDLHGFAARGLEIKFT